MPRKRALTAPPDDQPRFWRLRWHYACPCGWFDLQSNYKTEPETCPECGSPPTVK